MDTFIKKDIIKIHNKNIDILEDNIVVEYPFTIFLNDEEFITILCTPKSLKELAVGFLYAEGFITKISDIDNITIDKDKGFANITLHKDIDIIKKLHNKRVRTTGCGKGTTFYYTIDSVKSKSMRRDYELKVNTTFLFDNMKEFTKKSKLFEMTGGVHSVLISDLNNSVYFEDDVGRHNAVDKVIGHALLNESILDNKILFTSGRISSEMLLKTAKAGIPIIVSKSAPTSLAVELADQLNITLIGFIRGKRMNIYSHDYRINK